ncbi:MAG: HupE/UreJ family protein [Pseudomonadota bacterium]
MKVKAILSTLLTFYGFLFSPFALAHGGVQETAGLTAGFLHPATGFGHIVVAVIAGLWAAHSCRHCALCVAGFLLMMLTGSLLGLGGLALSHVDTLPVIAVITVGVVIALSIILPAISKYLVFGGFAFYYGFLHIIELTGPVSTLAFIFGMLSSTGLLMAFGVVLRQVIATRPALLR